MLYFRLVMNYEKYDVIYTHYPGPCKQLDGAGFILYNIKDKYTNINTKYIKIVS